MSVPVAATGTVGGALRIATARLAACSDSPRLDAELLLEAVLERPRSALYAHPEAILAPALAARFGALLTRRAAGEPIAYLLGRIGFWTLTLTVTPAVLVPRPETELLIEQALVRLPDGRARVADLGTGSGAIALALASERPGWQILGTDLSPAALALARHNAGALELGRVAWLRTRWCAGLASDGFDLIVSNPPYIAADDPHLAALTHEPATALVAGAGGLADLAAIAQQAGRCLRPGGWLLLEHGHTQGAALARLLRDAGWCEISLHRDLGDRGRVSAARRPGATT
ncbi:MAG TPA: peptide chain release factor N(5)-glutamine methyltransferase [Gammaproteobacteria bacterium]|nr:peptide chain release factor N(5)-glutamine methyltransferase [Gammaproteobacteria bacterium]